MKKIVPALYSSYGRYIDEFRSIPNINDCLKPVERRALYSLHKTAQKLTKSAKVVGDIIGLYHPHGDGCLHGDTKIYNPIQKEFITFKKAYEDNLSIPVLCFDSINSKIKIGQAHSFRIGKKSNSYIHMNTMKLDESDNKYHSLDVYATSNHPFLTNNNRFEKLEDISEEFELIRFKLNNNVVYWSDLSNFNFIQRSTIDENEITFYDFTVDEYQNMLIPIYQDLESKTIEFIVAHNSTYDTVVNLVNRGFAIGQGNFGYNAVKPVSAAAYRYCVVGDTLIPTNNGIYRIKNLENYTDSIQVEDLGACSKVNNWFNSGYDNVIKITTKHGYELIGNYKHPIVIKNPNKFSNYDIWIELENCQLGQEVLIKQNYPIDLKERKSKLDNIELFIIGLFYNSQFNKTPNDLIDEILLSDSNVEIDELISNKNITTSLSSHILLNIEENKLYKILYSSLTKSSNIYSIYKENSSNKVKKQKILKLLKNYLPIQNNEISDDCLVLSQFEWLYLLSGMFINNISYLIDIENNTIEIKLESNDEKFLKQIQVILLYNFNIISTFTKNDNKLESISKFCLIINDSQSLDNFDTYLNPYFTFNSKQISDEIRETIQKDVEYKNYIYDEIINIEPIKDVKQVYTLSMNSLTHSYVGNGFMNHNTEVKINPDLDRIAFELIKFAPYSDPELLNELQPNYIPCPVPIGLIGDGMINGISFNISRIPRFNLFDLFTRLTNIFQRECDSNVQPVTIIPNFPNFDIYEESPGELEKLLTTGKGSLILKPHYKVDGKGVHVYGRPPLGCSGWLKEDTDGKKIKYSCDDLSGRQGFEALFTPRNGARLNQDFINEVLSVIETRINFICNVWDEDLNKVVTKSIDELLLNSYNKWSDCYKSKLNFNADKIKQQIREMVVIELIRYLLHTYSSKIVTIDDVCLVYVDCVKNKILPNTFTTDITEDEIIAVCKKHSISKLFDYRINKQERENELQLIMNDLNNFTTASFNFAGKLIYNT